MDPRATVIGAVGRLVPARVMKLSCVIARVSFIERKGEGNDGWDEVVSVNGGVNGSVNGDVSGGVNSGVSGGVNGDASGGMKEFEVIYRSDAMFHILESDDDDSFLNTLLQRQENAFEFSYSNNEQQNENGQSQTKKAETKTASRTRRRRKRLHTTVFTCPIHFDDYSELFTSNIPSHHVHKFTHYSTHYTRITSRTHHVTSSSSFYITAHLIPHTLHAHHTFHIHITSTLYPHAFTIKNSLHAVPLHHTVTHHVHKFTHRTHRTSHTSHT